MGVLTDAEENELVKGLDSVEKIEKEVSLSWDGRNLTMRIPKEIADYLRLTKTNRFRKCMKLSIEENNGVVSKTFEIVSRRKPRRIIKKNGSKTKKNRSDR